MKPDKKYENNTKGSLLIDAMITVLITTIFLSILIPLLIQSQHILHDLETLLDNFIQTTGTVW